MARSPRSQLHFIQPFLGATSLTERFGRPHQHIPSLCRSVRTRLPLFSQGDQPLVMLIQNLLPPGDFRVSGIAVSGIAEIGGSEVQTSELQEIMRISLAGFCLNK